MSNLHKMKIKHQGMSLAEKEKCNCDLCKGLNIHKNLRKVETFDPKIKGTLQKIEPTKSIIEPTINSNI